MRTDSHCTPLGTGNSQVSNRVLVDVFEGPLDSGQRRVADSRRSAAKVADALVASAPPLLPMTATEATCGEFIPIEL